MSFVTQPGHSLLVVSPQYLGSTVLRRQVSLSPGSERMGDLPRMTQQVFWGQIQPLDTNCHTLDLQCPLSKACSPAESVTRRWKCWGAWPGRRSLDCGCEGEVGTSTSSCFLSLCFPWHWMSSSGLPRTLHHEVLPTTSLE